MAELPAGTVTFVFTDIEDSTSYSTVATGALGATEQLPGASLRGGRPDIVQQVADKVSQQTGRVRAEERRRDALLTHCITRAVLHDHGGLDAAIEKYGPPRQRDTLVARARARGSTIRARNSSGVRVVDPEESDVESTLAITAATWAIAMALGPILQIRKILAHKNSQNISIGYFIVLLVGFVLWLAYGVVASNLALVVPNAVAALVITATIVIAARYRGAPAAHQSESHASNLTQI